MRLRPIFPGFWTVRWRAIEVVIMRSGRRLVRLAPVETAPCRRTLGTAKGDFVVPDDFLDPPLPDDVLAEFER